MSSYIVPSSPLGRLIGGKGKNLSNCLVLKLGLELENIRIDIVDGQSSNRVGKFIDIGLHSSS